jgi:hypothetical protein
VTRKNLIMGMWTTLPFDRLEIFLGSLRCTTFDGDVCIFVDDVAPSVVSNLRSYGVMVERASPFHMTRLGPQVSRFFNYLGFLSRHASSYQNVLVTDLRDVVFQTDPFEHPLPADVVFAQERHPIGTCPATGSWVRAIYGDAMVHHLRDFSVSCSGTTFGTVSGMLDYLSAMAYEFCRLEKRLPSGWDQGVHNYVVRMRPPFNSYYDTTDSIVATLHYMPGESFRITSDGVLIDGRRVPVIHQWDRRQAVKAYVEANQQFRRGPASRRQPLAAPRTMSEAPVAPGETLASSNAIICYYRGSPDLDALTLFLASARATGFDGALHCVGRAFDDLEIELLTRFDCIAHSVADAPTSATPENIAHVSISRILDQLVTNSQHAPLDVLVSDSVHAGFIRNPFQTRTMGLSLYLEAPVRIGESEHNRRWLAAFGCPDGTFADRPIISSSLVRGSAETVQQFYQQLLPEITKNPELLSAPKVVQGAFNKLYYSASFDFPVTLHANGSQVYFEIWHCDLAIETEAVIKVGGTTPTMIVSVKQDSTLLKALKVMMQL